MPAPSETRFARLRARIGVPAGDLAWLSVAGGAVVLAAAFAWLAPRLSGLYPTPSGDLFVVWEPVVAPEPLEEARAALALATPFVLAAIVLAFGDRGPSRRALDPYVIAVQVAGAVLVAVAVLGQPRGGPLLDPDYFERYLVSVPNLIAGVVIGLLLTAAAVKPPAFLRSGSLRAWFSRGGGWRWAPLAIAIAATAIWLLPAVTTDATLARSGGLASGHIPVQGEDYFAAVNGRTPLVDYIAQYANLLPLALEPILQAVGPSITSYTISMCALSLLGMLAIYGTFAQVTRNPWAALALYVPWVALSLLPWNDIGPYREFNGNYFGVFPARYFGPFLLAWLCALALRGRRVPLFALFGVAGLVLVNNYEFGLGALLALFAATIAGWDRGLPVRARVLHLVVHAGAGLLAALAFVCAVLLIRTGELPNPALLTYFNQLFLRESFGLQPMSSLGLHWALYATYVAALLIAVTRYVRNRPDRALTGMLAFSAVFGLVTGMYFVGRSAQFQLMLLFPAWGLSLALVAWTAAGALRSAAREGRPLRRLLLPACAALIGFGVMLASIDRLPLPHRQIDRLRDGGTPDPDLARIEQEVESLTEPGEAVWLVAFPPDHLAAHRAGVVNVSPVNGRFALFTEADVERSLDQLAEEGGDLVIERASALPPGGIAFGIPELATLLRERGYSVVAEDEELQTRVWRRTG